MHASRKHPSMYIYPSTRLSSLSTRPFVHALRARFGFVSRLAVGAHRPSSLLAAHPRARHARTRETRTRRERDAFDRPYVGVRGAGATTSERETRSSARVLSLSRKDDTDDDMSAKPGSAKGKSATPFATMAVSPFLWCVEAETDETMRRETMREKRRRDARERRMNE